MTRVRETDRLGVGLLMLTPALFLAYEGFGLSAWAASHGSTGGAVWDVLHTLAVVVGCYGGYRIGRQRQAHQP